MQKKGQTLLFKFCFIHFLPISHPIRVIGLGARGLFDPIFGGFLLTTMAITWRCSGTEKCLTMQKKWQTKLYKIFFINTGWFLAFSPCKISAKYTFKKQWNLHLQCRQLHYQNFTYASSKQNSWWCGLSPEGLLGHLLYHDPDTPDTPGHGNRNIVRALSGLYCLKMQVKLKLLFGLCARTRLFRWAVWGAIC